MLNIIQSPSPNFSSRQGYKPEMIVIHCTDGNWPYDMQYLQNPNPGSVVGPVSAHYVVAPNGDVHQLVDLTNMAWHAGRVDHPTATLKKNADGTYVNPNYYSIGIETSMISTALPTAEQHATLMELVAQLAAQFSIPLDRVHIVGHREIYSLKTCPGTINVDTLLPQSTEQQMVAAVSEMIPQVSTLPVSKQAAFRAALSALLTSIHNFFKQ